MTKVTVYKGIDVFVDSKGKFHGMFDDEKVEADSLESFKQKMTVKMRTARTPVKRVKALKQSWGHNTPLEVEVTSVSSREGLYRTDYEFWTTTLDKEKRREKVQALHLFRFAPKKAKRVLVINSTIIKLETERRKILDSIRFTDETLMKAMGFKKEKKVDD